MYKINVKVHTNAGVRDINEDERYNSENFCLLYTGDGLNGHYDVLKSDQSDQEKKEETKKEGADKIGKGLPNQDEGAQLKDFIQTPKINFYLHSGEVEIECKSCGALYWKGEKVTKNCCHGGKIYLHELSKFPEELEKLFLDKDFRSLIRNYNSTFAFASFSAKNVTSSKGVYTMKIQGPVHHTAPTTLFGSSSGHGGQIYIYEPELQLETPPGKGLGRENGERERR